MYKRQRGVCVTESHKYMGPTVKHQIQMAYLGRAHTRQNTSCWFAIPFLGGIVVSKSDDPGGNRTHANSVAAPHTTHYATTDPIYTLYIPGI